MKRNSKQCELCGCYISLSNFSRHSKSKQCLRGGKYIPNSSLYCRYCKKIFKSSSGRGVHEIQCDNNSKSVKVQKYRKYTAPKVKPLKGKHGGYRENAGRSKKFRVEDTLGNHVTLQSSFELRCSFILEELGYAWIRPKALKYGDRNYFADFYLIDYNVYLDPKNNYKIKIDREKINAVIRENGVKLYILSENQITKEYIKALIQST